MTQPEYWLLVALLAAQMWNNTLDGVQLMVGNSRWYPMRMVGFGVACYSLYRMLVSF